MTQVERDPSQTDRAFSLRLAMRRLWSDHVIWTREYVVAVTPGAHVAALSETASAAAARLLRNQEDIGNAIVPFYGPAAGAQLTDLLKQHIMIAVELISAASTGDNAQFKVQDMRWDDNAHAIANLLSSANPNWPELDVFDLLDQHLRLTKAAVVARLQGRYADDVDAFDQIFTEILTVADVLSAGLLAQFADRF